MFAKLFDRLVVALMSIGHNREPDRVIGGMDRPYMLRWYLIPRNRFCNVYLHCFLRSGDDRALHDHPWPNLSILLEGKYIEHTILDGGIHHRQLREAGAIKARLPSAAHRIELVGDACWTLFITGPRIRQWGFHCPDAGWVHWRDFVAEHDAGEVGRGCGD